MASTIRGMPSKERLTITVAPELVEAGQRAVQAGDADSISAWISNAISEKVTRDNQHRALAAAIADFEAEHGEITDDEIAAQRRTDRSRATVVRGKVKSP